MNGQTNLGSIIAQLRRSAGWTQADLAQKLGITAQAVSQWERGETMPDILTLPMLAEVFGCSIDALYKGEEETAEAPAASTLAVPDDGQWRAVVMCGSRIVEMADLPEEIKKSAEKSTLTVRGDIAGGLTSSFPVTVEGNLRGNVQCGALTVSHDITGNVEKCGALAVKGSIGGNVSGGGGISVGGSVGGNAHANGGLSVGGNVNGGASANGGLTVGGALSGYAHAGGALTVRGGVTGSLNSAGDIRVEGSVGGDVHAQKSVTVLGDVHGNAEGVQTEPQAEEGKSFPEKVSRFVGSVLDSVRDAVGGTRSVPDPSKWEIAEEGEYQAVLMRDGNIVDMHVIPAQGERVILQIMGDAAEIRSMFSVTVGGSVEGDITAQTVAVECDLNGDVNAEGSVTVGGDLNGDVDCGPLTVEGDIGGDVDCGTLTVSGSIDGDVDCGPLTVHGDIGGDVDCGDARIGGSVDGDVDGGTVTVEGDVNGDISADTVTVGGSTHGDIN